LKNAQPLYKPRHLLNLSDFNSGPKHYEGFGCVSGQDVVGSFKKVEDVQYQDWSMAENLPLWHTYAKTRPTCPKSPQILKANYIYFWWKSHDIKFHSEKETLEFLRSKCRWAARFFNGVRFICIFIYTYVCVDEYP